MSQTHIPISVLPQTSLADGNFCFRINKLWRSMGRYHSTLSPLKYLLSESKLPSCKKII